MRGLTSQVILPPIRPGPLSDQGAGCAHPTRHRRRVGADLSGEVLTVRALPRQADEFTFTRCFLVHHRSQLVSSSEGTLVCRDCAP